MFIIRFGQENGVQYFPVDTMMQQQFRLLAVALILAVAFVIVPVAADATQIAVNAGNSQSATAGTAVATAPSVIVKDAGDLPVSGVSVTFAVASGGGSVTGGSATTGADGIATVGSWTLGTTAGANTLTATSGTLTGSPVTFTATGTAGTATQMAVNAGNGQSATVGTAVATGPSVIVKDANNNPVSGVSVTFSIASGGGTVSGATTTTTTTTNANGIATLGSWTLGPAVGSNTLTAASGALTTVTFTATGTSATSAPTISTVTPSSGINNGYIRSVDISGSGFVSPASVRLVKSGQTNITMVNANYTSSHIVGDFNLNGALAGTWDVVVINPDLGIVTSSSGFTVINASSASTVTVISPSSGTTNTTVGTTISGTGFQSNARMRLARSGYNDILGTVTSTSATSLVGTFDLTGQAPGSWNACVLYDGTTRVCGPTFTINALASTANGSISFTSTPSSATVYVDSTKKGTTPFTLYNVTPGSYAIKVQKDGYLDWANRVTVTAGNRTEVAAKLTAEDTSVTTAATPLPTITTATLPPTTKRTIATPTPWPSDTPASPVEVPVLIGAVALGLVLLRKH